MAIFDRSKIQNILFIDIETASQHAHFEDLDERLQRQWEKKVAAMAKDIEKPASHFYQDRAAIYAEFGKIICIGMGYFVPVNGQLEFRCKTMHGHDEVALLQNFIQLLNRDNKKNFQWLCAHNGREFDFPYLCRRMLVHRLALPAMLEDLATKKPWEVPHLDTMDMWKFGDWKSYTSLDLLAAIFNIPTSKDDIDGSMVNQVYHQQKDLSAIAQYCLKDVVVLARLFQCLIGMDMIADSQIKMVE